MATQRRRSGTLGRVLLWTALAGALAVGVAAFVVYHEITADLPPVDQILHYKPPVATRIFADDGTLIGEFYVERRYLVPLDRIPAHVRLAFLAAEDADFYRHRGIDPVSIGRAALANVLHHQVVQGGSTITQQVVKQLLLTPERSYERKQVAPLDVELADQRAVVAVDPRRDRRLVVQYLIDRRQVRRDLTVEEQPGDRDDEHPGQRAPEENPSHESRARPSRRHRASLHVTGCQPQGKGSTGTAVLRQRARLPRL